MLDQVRSVMGYSPLRPQRFTGVYILALFGFALGGPFERLQETLVHIFGGL